jgi:hypothetical protein
MCGFLNRDVKAFYFILIEQSIHEQGRRTRAHTHSKASKQASCEKQ